MRLIDKSLKAQILYHTDTKKEMISSVLWEKIICNSYQGGEWIEESSYIDGKVNNIGLNIKSITKKLNDNSKAEIKYNQSRIPLIGEHDMDEEEIISATIDSLNSFKDKAKSKYGLDSIVDIIVLHKLDEDKYTVKVLEYPDINLETNRDRLSRNRSDSKKYQNCAWIKRFYPEGKLLFSITYTIDTNDPPIEWMIKEYLV